MKLIKLFFDVLKKIDFLLAKFQELMVVVLLVAMVVVGGIQVFGRYLLSFAPAWTEEILRFSLIYLGFFSIALTARKDGHVAMDILQENLKNNRTRMYFYIVSRLLMVVFLVIVTPWGFELIRRMQRSMASSVPISWSYIYAVLPIGTIMGIISILAALPDNAAKVGRGEK